MKMVELNHIIAGSFPLSGSTVVESPPPTVTTAHPVFDLRAGSLFKLDAIDKEQLRELGATWKQHLSHS